MELIQGVLGLHRHSDGRTSSPLEALLLPPGWLHGLCLLQAWLFVIIVPRRSHSGSLASTQATT